MRTNESDYPRNDNRSETIQSTGNVNESVPIEKFVDMALKISTLLLESGAHCERINRNIKRLAKNTNYRIDMLISFTAISISVTDNKKPGNTVSKSMEVKHHGAHFGVLTETSLLTWKLADNEISLNELEDYLEKLKNSTKYSVWLVRLLIGIACGSLCLLAGGNWMDGLFTLVASAVGLSVRQEMVKRRFNLMVSVLCSALITTLISGLNVLYEVGQLPESSVATAVLFLIPGVPLINSIIDLLEGYIPVGLARGAFGGFILLCIAVGMFLGMSLIGINNFHI